MNNLKSFHGEDQIRGLCLKHLSLGVTIANIFADSGTRLPFKAKQNNVLPLLKFCLKEHPVKSNELNLSPDELNYLSIKIDSMVTKLVSCGRQNEALQVQKLFEMLHLSNSLFHIFNLYKFIAENWTYLKSTQSPYYFIAYCARKTSYLENNKTRLELLSILAAILEENAD